MSRLDDQYSQHRSEIPKVASTVGVFVAMAPGGLATVNTQGSTVTVRCDGWTPPLPGMSVRLESANGIMRVVGPSGPRSAVGEVLASVDGDTRARVLVDGREWTLPVIAPYVPLPTDGVVIDWSAGYVIGEQAAARVDETPIAPGGGGEEFKDLLVQATDSGAFFTGGAGRGNGEVYTSISTRGAWFYSSGFGALAGANISRVEIYLPMIREQNNLQFGLHSSPSKPGSDPGALFLTTHTGPRNGWVDLPAAFGNALRDNPGYGIVVHSPGGGQNQWTGRNADAMSGAIRFTGTR